MIFRRGIAPDLPDNSADLAADNAAKRRATENRASVAANHAAGSTTDSGTDSSIALCRSEAVAGSEGSKQGEDKYAPVQYGFHKFLHVMLHGCAG